MAELGMPVQLMVAVELAILATVAVVVAVVVVIMADLVETLSLATMEHILEKTVTVWFRREAHKSQAQTAALAMVAWAQLGA
jgi:hypothetical protein